MDWPLLFSLQLLLLLLTIWSGLSIGTTEDCPNSCKCNNSTILCRSRRLKMIQKNYTIRPLTETVDYSGNMLSILGPYEFSIEGIESMKNLYLNDSNVATLSRYTFSNLTNLVYLDLSENIIEQVPKRLIEQNKKLLVLKLSRNIFREPPELISESLEELDISESHLEVFGEMNVINLPNLKYLDLQQNKLQLLSPNTFSVSHRLAYVDLRYNNWKCNCGTAKLFYNLAKKNLINTDEPIRCKQQRKKYVDIYKKEGAAYWKRYCLNETIAEETKKSGVDVLPGESLKKSEESENLTSTVPSQLVAKIKQDREGMSALSTTFVVLGVFVLLAVSIIPFWCYLNHRKKNNLYRGLSSNSFRL